MVRRNLMGELSPEEFSRLNEMTAGDTGLAALRLEIEDAWDVSGPELQVVKQEETDKLYQRILKKEKKTTILSLRNVVSGIAALFILIAGALWLMRESPSTFLEANIAVIKDLHFVFSTTKKTLNPLRSSSRFLTLLVSLVHRSVS